MWGIVVGLCLVAGGVRLWAALRIEAPWIMPDELIYRELAASVGSSGHLRVRGESIGLVSLYPIVLAPLWRAGSLVAAYDASKVVNVVCMTSASLLVFVWGRRLVSARGALVAAGLSLLLPLYVYTGELMTENLFLPAFLLAAFAIASTLPDPRRARQAVALAAVALACSVRLEGLVLLPVWATAAAGYAALAATGAEGRRRAVIRYAARFWPSAAIVATAAAVGAAFLVRGESLTGLLGFYRGVLDSPYTIGGSLQWFSYHLADLSLAVGLVPAAAFLVLLTRARRVRLPAPVLALLAVTAATTLWLAAGAGVWASWHGDGIRERYVLYAVPLILLAFVVSLEQKAVSSRRVAVAAAICCCLAPLALPLDRLLGAKVLSDAPSLTGLRWLAERDSLTVAETVFAAAAALAFLVAVTRARRAAAVSLAFVAAVSVANSVAATRLATDQSRRVLEGTRAGGWVDDTVGASGNVAIVATGNVDPMQLWQTEFWNRSVRRVYYLDQPEPGTLPTAPVTIDARSGRLTLPGGRPLAADALVVDRSLSLDSRALAGLSTGLELRAYSGTAVARRALTGLYPDGWTRPTLVYTQLGCRGISRLIFAFGSDPHAPGPQEAIARQGGTIVGSGRVAPGGTLYLRAPLDASRGPCSIRIDITPWTPARSEPGSTDTRTLGLRYENVVTLP